MDLTGKTAIVTGAGQGIGRGIALKLAKQGADVVVAELNRKTCEETTAQVKGLGRKTMAAVVDCTSYQQVTQMVDKAVAQFGKVDILVNNVGVPLTAPFVNTTPEEWDKSIATDFKSALCCIRAVLPHMIERKGGRIVSISSDAARVGTGTQAVYSGCKAAIVAFTKALVREVSRYNILANVVSPGTTLTPTTVEAKEQMPQMFEALLKTIPLRRFAEPEDIANAVAFLVSDEASFITGQDLSVNGGGVM